MNCSCSVVQLIIQALKSIHSLSKVPVSALLLPEVHNNPHARIQGTFLRSFSWFSNSALGQTHPFQLQGGRLHKTFSHQMALAQKPDNYIPTVNLGRKLELRDASLPLPTSWVFLMHVDTISVMDTLFNNSTLEILWALKTANVAQLNSHGTFILRFLQHFKGRLMFFRIELPPAGEWTAWVSLQTQIH